MVKRGGIRRVLIVEDNVDLRRAIARTLAAADAVVVEVGTAAAAIEALTPVPDLVIADVSLPDGSALPVLEAMRSLSPEPLKIAISGTASAEEAFQLAQLGVLEYLPKPFALRELREAIDRVLRVPPALDSQLKASVGQVSLREMRGHVRRVMVEHALALSSGSRTGAARLLGLSRQAVQQIERQLGFERKRGRPHPVDSSLPPGPP